MSWVSPANRSTGDFITASIWNQDVVSNPAALRGGAIALSSQAAQDFIFASSATQFGRVAAIDGKVPKFTTLGGWAMDAASPWELLKANSGADSTAGATTVDTYALASTLTAKDTLMVYVDVESSTQQTAQPMSLRNETDGLNIANLSSNLAAGEFGMMAFRLRQSQIGPTKVNTLSQVDGSHTQYAGVQTTFTTNWTGAWSVGLRHNGVTAGGTFRWSWSVYVLRGQ